MPNARELKKLLAPLLMRRPDLGYHARLLFWRPVTHYLRGVCFTTSIYTELIKVEAFCDLLFEGGSLPYLGTRGYTADQPYNRPFPDTWKTNPDRGWPEIFLALERDALPEVQHIDDPVAFASSAKFSPNASGSQWEIILGFCALGEFDEANRLLDLEVRKKLDWGMAHYGLNIPELRDDELKFSEADFLRLYYLYRVLKRNRAEVMPLLHEWEAHKVRILKLEKFWTPTPFPGERR